jgi:hypothetical protein
VESSGSETACLGLGWRLARGAGGHALFPTQDEKDSIPGAILGNCAGVARLVLGHFEWWGKGNVRVRLQLL